MTLEASIPLQNPVWIGKVHSSCCCKLCGKKLSIGDQAIYTWRMGITHPVKIDENSRAVCMKIPLTDGL